jgi:PAS domain S-box-containing protein
MGTSPRHQGDTPEWADANCRAVLEAAPDAMLVVNRAGEIVAANLQAQKFFGYSREHLIGSVVESLIPARLRDRHRQHRENFFANPETQARQVLEIFAVRIDALEVPVDVSLSHLTIGPETFAISAIRDATERRRMEELKAGEEHSRRLVQRSSVAMIVSRGLEQRVESMNDKFTALFGYTIDDVPDVAHWWPLAYPDEAYRQAIRTEWQARVEKAIRNMTDIEPMEATVRCKDGSIRHIEAHLSCMGHTNLVTLIDLTERKRAEEALRGSEARLRLAAQAGKMYAYEWDVATDKVVRSEEYVNVLGHSHPAKQLTRQELLSSVHPEDRAVFVGSIEQLTPQNPNAQISYRVLRPDGSVVWLEKNARGFFDEQGKLLRVIGMVANITERKLAEEALRESEEKFRSVFRDAGVGMVIVSPEGRFLATNGTFCDCLGYTEEELVARTVESVTFPEDWPAFSQKLREALTDERGFQWFQKRCLHKSGRIVYTESSASLIRNRNGEPQYFVGEVLDITKPKEAEEALSDMTRKLVEAQEQERARIARELHDDINQRLAMLAIELEQLKDNPSEVETRAQELRKQTNEISDDVQALSHDLHSSKLEYLGVVAGIKSWCKEFAKRQKLEIDFRSDLSSAFPPVIGLTLFRVLQEALHNAAKHSGVSRVGVQLHEESNQIHLIVTDLGRGFNVEATLHGKGLGLTSMRERIRLVNGTVAIDSKPMRGSTIHVRVPFKSEHGSQRAAG